MNGQYQIATFPVPSQTHAGAELFDAYIAVDWSASSKRKTGADSVWFAVLERGPGKLAQPRNPATRQTAEAELQNHLCGLVARNQRVLIGFDFPFGYPAGFVALLSKAGEASHESRWLSVWDAVAHRIAYGQDNANNRFETASALNELVIGRRFPFWGHPQQHEGRYPSLGATNPRGYGLNGDPAELRICEVRVRGPQSAWKLFGNGSAGGQALLGIPVVRRLRTHPELAAISRVWPFETGLAPVKAPPGTPLVVHAEIYPSILAVAPLPGEVKDCAQVRQIVERMAQLDQEGFLGDVLSGPDDLSADERLHVEDEEGWSLDLRTGWRPPAGIT